jgi:hypothetical protein
MPPRKTRLRLRELVPEVREQVRDGGLAQDGREHAITLLDAHSSTSTRWTFGGRQPSSGLDAGALWEDMKAGGSVGLKHRSAWRRMAVVTDKDWIRHASAAAGWLAPGELRIFDPAQQEEATAWLAER